MSNREFTAQRTMLANAFATAGAELLEYMAITDTAVAALSDTKPEKYAIAGTLPGILQMGGKMMDEDGVTGLEGLQRYRESWEGMGPDSSGDYVKFADVERLLAAPAAAEKPTGDLTDEQIGKLYREAQDQSTSGISPSLYFARAIERAAIAAHLARQPKAEQPDTAVLLKTLESLTLSMDGRDKNQPGWHHRSGWNDALRRVMDVVRATAHATVAPAGAQNAEAIRNQTYAKCIEIAESELSNTNALASMPPQSAAAFSIINRIRFLQTGSATTQEGAVSAERSGDHE
jgi:hypothetical protein